METSGRNCKPFYFFLLPSYWGCRSAKPVAPRLEKHNSLNIGKLAEEIGNINSSVLLAGDDSSVGSQNIYENIIEVRGLGKTYSNGKVAVEGLDIDISTSQIFTLLGHNGAGKTTTLSMLSGSLEQTRGSIKAFGLDVTKDKTPLIEDMGVCPQYDALFEKLTVKEHLEMYARFKNLTPIMIKEDTNRLIEQFKFIQDQDKLPEELSSGARRKLTLAIAFLANPRFILLDEPTIGMDAVMRKEIWEVLELYKRDRVIFLTTHYMDEADELGDTIGILNQGKLLCCGSSRYLKHKFGIGYHLNIVLKREMGDDEIDDLTELIKKYVAGSELSMQAGTELMFQLPFVEQEKYKSLFTELDETLDDYGIRSYGVSITTLEDVFMRVGEGDGTKVKHWKETSYIRTAAAESEPTDFKSMIRDQATWSDQLKLMCVTKIKELKRSVTTIFFTLAIPMMIILAGLALHSFPLETKTHTYNVANDFDNSYVFANGHVIRPSANQISPSEFLIRFADASHQIPIYKELSWHKTTHENLSDFASQIEEHQPFIGDPIYGSYYIYEINKKDHIYSFVTLFNLTSSHSSIAFSHALGNYIIQWALETNTVHQMSITKMRVSTPLKDAQQAVGYASVFIFVFSLSISIIPGIMAAHLVRENRRGIRKYLSLSGLKPWVYWGSHFIINALNMYALIIPVIGLYYLFGFKVFFFNNSTKKL